MLKAFRRPALVQDRRVLGLQREWRHDEAPPYAAGPLDVMGPTVWRLANGLVEPERERLLTMDL